jgi:hypothetical protein
LKGSPVASKLFTGLSLHINASRYSMKNYTAPALTNYGSIADLTGVLGNVSTGDVLVDTNGNVEQEGNLSVDACPTQDFEGCIINP